MRCSFPGGISKSVGTIGAAWCLVMACGLAAQAPSPVPKGYSEAWLALLHYWDDKGAWLSEISDPSFFLDPEGARSPEREWAADERAFLAPVDNDAPEQHARCRFPARFALMTRARQWSLDEMPPVDCPEEAAHRRRLSATSLSVIFVAQRLNNPASAFGHAMLYFGSDGAQSSALGDYSVSFEANTDGISPLSYLPRGLFGGLVAGYRIEPLYQRVRRYERGEQRDLWIFPLRMDQADIDQLVRHLWEIQGLSFGYGFFAGNCAQKLLAIVHAVAPQYEILPYPSVAVLPAEVARRLVDRVGLAGEPIRRTSLLGSYGNQVARLDVSEREQLKSMIADRAVPDGASEAVLSAALLWSEIEIPYQAFRREGEPTDNDDVRWRRALWMSRIGKGDLPENLPSQEGPAGASLLDAHRPSRVAVYGGYRNDSGSEVGIDARWLLHGAIDPDAGYPMFSSLEVGHVVGGVSSRGVVLESATILRVERLAPSSNRQSHFAWAVDIGARRIGLAEESPLQVGLEFDIGYGASIRRPEFSLATYAMVGARPGLVLADRGAFFSPTGLVSGGLLATMPGDVRARLSTEYTLPFWSREDGGVTIAAVVRKGLLPGLDLEVATTMRHGGSGVTLALVSFR